MLSRISETGELGAETRSNLLENHDYRSMGDIIWEEKKLESVDSDLQAGRKMSLNQVGLAEKLALP